MGITFVVHFSCFAAEVVQHVEGKLDLGVRLIPKRDRRLLIRAQAHLMRDESEAISGDQCSSGAPGPRGRGPSAPFTLCLQSRAQSAPSNHVR